MRITHKRFPVLTCGDGGLERFGSLQYVFLDLVSQNIISSGHILLAISEKNTKYTDDVYSTSHTAADRVRHLAGLFTSALGLRAISVHYIDYRSTKQTALSQLDDEKCICYCRGTSNGTHNVRALIVYSV